MEQLTIFDHNVEEIHIFDIEPDDDVDQILKDNGFFSEYCSWVTTESSIKIIKHTTTLKPKE